MVEPWQNDSPDGQLRLGLEINPGPPLVAHEPRSTDHVTLADGDAAIVEVFSTALKLRGKPYLLGLLKFVTKFRAYSSFNLALVYSQRPGAVAVGTLAYWERHNRTVKADALPIVILKPGGPVCFVYELADTEGERTLFGDEELDLDPFAVAGEFSEDQWLRLLSGVAKEKFCIVKEVNFGWGQAGLIRKRKPQELARVSKGARRFTISIAGRLRPAQKAMTLAHELAHLYCGHLGEVPKCWWTARPTLSHEAEEFEAEVAAWIVASRAGLKTASAEYLTDKASQTVLNEISVDAMVKAANRIEALGFPKAIRR